MTTIFGLGIEAETTFNFTDENRKSRVMTVQESPEDFSPYGGGKWNQRNGWKRSNLAANSMFKVTGDSTVDGNSGRGGYEVQTEVSHSINVKPKEMCMGLFSALNDGSKVVKSSLPYVLSNPFGTQVGFNTIEGRGRFGSYHINITLPYEREKLASDSYVEDYWKKLFKGIKVVRALQPLFIAMTGGADLKSVGTPERAEGSGRQAYLTYGNAGNVSLNEEFRSEIFKTIEGQSSKFKYGGTYPTFRDELEENVNDGGVKKGNVGDIVVKQYPNVDKKIRTIEFRFFDPFFAPNLYEIMKVLVASLEHGKNVGDITDAKTNIHWNKTMALIIEEGWNARVPKEYQTMIKEKLDLDIKVKDNKRADLVFQEVALSLWNKNKNGFWVKSMFDEFEPPKVLNLNRYNWDMQFRHRYVNETGFKTYIDKFLTILKKIDARASGGWVKVTFDSSGKMTIRDVLLDDERFGTDMATEDYEDILFLLERIGAVELKVDDSGLIQELKVLYTDPKEVMSRIDNLQTIDGVEETYFGRHIEEARAEAVRQEQEYTEGSRVRVSETGNIDMSQLRIVRVAPEDETSLFYNRRDLQEIFDNASFLDESGQQFSVRVIPAKITYQSSQKMAFWERNGRIIKLYIDAESFDVEGEMSDIISRMKSHFYSVRSVTQSNVFTDNLNVEEFFARLITVSQSIYNKSGQPTKISLDKAGLETLKEFGIRIVSLSRGQTYFIGDKIKYAKLKQRYGDKIQLIKYMPYQKGVFVSKQGEVFTLIMNKKQIDNFRRSSK